MVALLLADKGSVLKQLALAHILGPHGIFATLSSRLIKILGHLCQPGHKWDIGLNSGTVPAKPGHLATMLCAKQLIYIACFTDDSREESLC